ncbi:MAG: zf-HC2 domain-containing protein [Planctomycetota bacterium]|nr:zf-HC2 domain-containing protein [Planctomycetota bacterium]
MTNRCEQTENVVAYLQAQLDPAERDRMTAHLRDCPECSAMLADCGRLLTGMKELPVEPPRSDLADQVLGEIRFRTARTRRRLAITAVVAASLIVVGAVATVLVGRDWREAADDTARGAASEAIDHSEAVSRALDWLARNQQPNGGWPVGKLGGDEKYEIALSALALAALSGCEPELRANYAGNIKTGVDYLLRRQRPDGRFAARPGDTLYNHCIATACLLELYGSGGEARLKEPAKYALDCICMAQTVEGGWNYTGVEGEAPNSAVSIWALQALLWGEAMGFEGLQATLEKGFEWLGGLTDVSGRLGYGTQGDFPYGPETLSAMASFCYRNGGSRYLATDEKVPRIPEGLVERMTAPGEIDYYQSYFLAYLEHPLLAEWKGNLLEHLVAKQARNDVASGSWEPGDRWGQTGGKVYATALAALILEADLRGPQLRSWAK